MKRRPVTAITAALATAAVLVGCGQPSTTLDNSTLAHLRRDVAALASPAAQHHHGAARAAVATLTADLAAARRAGTITDIKFTTVRAAALALARDLRPNPASTAPATSPTPVSHGNDQGDIGKHANHGHGNGQRDNHE